MPADDNAGWFQKVLLWDWHQVALDGFPGWQIEKDRSPAFAKLQHVRRNEKMVESHQLCIAWDDVATARFYQRDWTDDGIPFVREGEIYWSGWWFQTFAERDRFLVWVPTVAPLAIILEGYVA